MIFFDGNSEDDRPKVQRKKFLSTDDLQVFAVSPSPNPNTTQLVRLNLNTIDNLSEHF